MSGCPPRARVCGAGPTGALAALALAQAGWEVDLEDPLTSEQLAGRSRAYALTHSSRLLLQRLGLWDALGQALIPFRELQLCDLELHRSVPFGPADLGAAARQVPGAAAVGWVLQHRPLIEVLLRHLGEHPSVRLALGRAGEAGSVDLLVAADGSRSPSRERVGIGCWSLPYHQSCLTAQVRLRGFAADQAWELFRREGPFALLPLGGDRAQVVWSAPPARLRRLESLEPAAFLDALAAVLPDQLQPEALLDTPRAFPVALELARGFQRGGTVLLGEAAHRCHPVGGQGLNLCWRDVAQLQRQAAQAVGGRLAVSAVARTYARGRWADVLLTLLSTDLLVRLFSNRRTLPLGLRRLALGLLQRSAALRRLLLRSMTLGPCRLNGRWSE